MQTIPDHLARRFGETIHAVDEDLSLLTTMVARGSCRDFVPEPVPRTVIDLLCATALCAPSKSDLQQRDIIVIEDPVLKAALLQLTVEQSWTGQIPHLLVFCGNNHRQRLLHDMHGLAFANDHLDAFFNAATDAAIALAGFTFAAEALGYGCCPISALRNHADEVSQLLNLPEHVFPFAGLAFGIPRSQTATSCRLPLSMTVHTDSYQEQDPTAGIAAYDLRRREVRPYDAQRREAEFGQSEEYGWSLDKVRQYSLPERADFGTYIRGKGFNLD